MPTRLDGRRAFTQFGFAQNKLWGLKNVFDGQPVLGQRHNVPGGHTTAAKLNRLGRTTVDIPDPYLAFVKLNADTSTLPRYVGARAELLEDAIGTNHTPNQSAAVPFQPYAAPHHIGGGFWSNPLYDANPVEDFDDRYSTPKAAQKLVAGIEIWSKHPIRKYVPFAAYAEAPLDAPAQPFIGVCPLGERTSGVYEFLFHVGQIDADPIAVKTDTEHMSTGDGTPQSLPAPPANSITLFTEHWCPIARGEAAFMQVFASTTGGAVAEPRAVFIRDWGATLQTLGILSIDTAYEANPAEPDLPMPPNRTSFARLSETSLMFMYYNSKHEDTRLFVSHTEGASWSALPLPLSALDWIRHRPVGLLVGGPSLLTPLGENAMMFNTLDLDTGGFFTWYTVDGAATWSQMLFGNDIPVGASYPGVGPTVIRPYVDANDQGELAMLVREPITTEVGVQHMVTIYATLDLGASWKFRGVAIPPDVADNGFGFNQHTAYVGTYDRPAPVIAGRPDMMRFVP